jgi:hypothetical protein
MLRYQRHVTNVSAVLIAIVRLSSLCLIVGSKKLFICKSRLGFSKINYDLGVDVQRRLLEIKPHAAMENIPPKRRHMTKIGGLNTGKTARRKTERYIREIKEASKRIEERERGTK